MELRRIDGFTCCLYPTELQNAHYEDGVGQIQEDDKQPNYSYKSLTQGDSSFRLLALESSDQVDGPVKARLRDANLSNKKDTFAALSYVWGAPGDRVTITLDGADFFIQANLCRFLRQVRRFGCSNIWLDAICVNQNNIPEREQQVGLMQRIYPQAEHVLVYLGEDADNSDLALNIWHT